MEDKLIEMENQKKGWGREEELIKYNLDLKFIEKIQQQFQFQLKN